jgi:hypothetical protein
MGKVGSRCQIGRQSDCRHRLSKSMLAEIALALGELPEEVQNWRQK